MDAPLMSTADLADYIQKPIATIYAWRVRGEGPSAIRVGRDLRYRRSDVEQWLQGLEDRKTPTQ
jgi:predicted DNA-binding transcriptional regulator AlpA